MLGDLRSCCGDAERLGHAGEEAHVGRGGMNKIRGLNSLFTQRECCGESQVKSGHALEKES